MSATNYLSFINSQIAGGDQAAPKPELIRRAVTLSRQTGSGAQVIAQMLAARLQEHHRDNTGPWTVFDRNLMEKVLEEHQLPTYLASSFPEDRISAMEDTLHDIFGLHPPQETIVRQTAETIMGLAELGNAILIGRGGSIITAKMPRVLHVRLVAPLELRIARISESRGITADQARAFCLEEDEGRKRYVRKYFKADINDPAHYHLVINTGNIPCDLAAQLLEEALRGLG